MSSSSASCRSLMECVLCKKPTNFSLANGRTDEEFPCCGKDEKCINHAKAQFRDTTGGMWACGPGMWDGMHPLNCWRLHAFKGEPLRDMFGCTEEEAKAERRKQAEERKQECEKKAESLKRFRVQGDETAGRCCLCEKIGDTFYRSASGKRVFFCDNWLCEAEAKVQLSLEEDEKKQKKASRTPARDQLDELLKIAKGLDGRHCCNPKCGVSTTDSEQDVPCCGAKTCLAFAKEIAAALERSR